MVTAKRKRTQDSSPTTAKRGRPRRQAAAAAAAARRQAALIDSDFASESSASDQQYNTASSDSETDTNENDSGSDQHDDSNKDHVKQKKDNLASDQPDNTKTKTTASQGKQSKKVDHYDNVKAKTRGNQGKHSNKADQKTKVDSEDSEDENDDVVLTANDFYPPKISVPEPENSPFADAVSPSSMIFMATLMVNNDREFMKLHEDRWKATRKDFMDFVDLLAKELHTLDNTVLVQPAKDAIYRQHRDLRFTADRIPYKCTLKASFTREGKKSPLPGYHISLKPGNETRIVVGIFQPDTTLKQRMRSGIIRQGHLLREALSTDTVKEVFGSVGTDLLDGDDRLKVAPKGIDKNHPEIELLRYNSMFVVKKMDDLDVVSEGFLDKILDVYEALLPFVTVLNAWIA